MSTAVISPCGQYRYNLTRGDENRMAVVMLNPSTADANKDDNTIRKLREFATRFGYDGLDVCNVYAYRATKPKDLRGKPVEEIVGPDNWMHLDRLAREHKQIIVAWGANVTDLIHESHVIRALRFHGAKLMCFGTTGQGFPRHPLYIAYGTPLQEYTQ